MHREYEQYLEASFLIPPLRRQSIQELTQINGLYACLADDRDLSNNPKELRSRSLNDMGGFLNGLEAQKGIGLWQVDQARKALIFLYRDFFKLNLDS